MSYVGISEGYVLEGFGNLSLQQWRPEERTKGFQGVMGGKEN